MRTSKGNGMNISTGRSVRFDDRHLHVELSDGRIISTPLQWYPELIKATVEQISDYTFICSGTGIEWPRLDYHLSIESMLIGQSQAHAA
jgi:hypothetical protein